MTQTTFNKLRALKTGLTLACFLVAATGWSQVAPGSADVSYNIGYNHVGAGPNDDFAPQSGNSFTTGGNGGININQYIEVGGEFNFFQDPQPEFSPVSASIHILNYGALARFNLAPNSKVVPYGLFAFGGSHATASASEGGDSGSVSENGYYVGFGGGASIYLGQNWGVRAELRDNYNHFSAPGGGGTDSTNVVAMTGGVFYQFGGHSARKK